MKCQRLKEGDRQCYNKTIMIKLLKYKSNQKEKTAFYCSDYGKFDFELYHSFKSTPYTNPPEWFETLKWGAGKGVEMAMLDILKENGITGQEYVQEENGRVDFVRQGVTIHGYIDAMTTGDKVNSFGLKAGCPIEIKSINNKNAFDIKNYDNGEPRENYVAQLSIYMDSLGVDTGYLFVSSIDGLNTYWFECKHIKDKVYKCGKVEIDLDVEYKRWKNVFENYIQKDIEPGIDVRYKIPVKDIVWDKVSKGDIGKARNGHKVIGDADSWKIQYSNWKDLILKKQGVTAGYTDAEVAIINELTRGYTTWK